MSDDITMKFSKNLVKRIKNNFKLSDESSDTIAVRKAIFTGIITANNGITSDNNIISIGDNKEISLCDIN